VIVPVRDPLARSLSLCYHAHRCALSGRTELEDVRHLVRVYDEHFWLWAHASPWEAVACFDCDPFNAATSSWHQREVRRTLGVEPDLLGPIPPSGFLITRGKIDLLAVRMDKLQTALPSALSEFLGVTIESVPSENRTSQPVYAEFIRQARPAPDRVDALLNLPDIAWQFSAEELEDLRKRWSH
jgi:hypothetical protein